MKFSLRGRFAIAFAVAFLVTLAILFLTLHYSLRNILVKDLDEELGTFSDAIITDASADGRPPTTDRLIAALSRDTLERFTTDPIIAVVFSATGQPLAAATGDTLPGSSGRTRPADPPATSAASRAAIRAPDLQRLADGETIHRSVKSTRGQKLRLHIAPVIAAGDLVGVVETASPLGPVIAATDRLQTLLLVEGAVAVVVATAAGYLVARGGLRPLDDVATLAEDIEAHDLTQRLNLRHAPPEIARLADTFDAMLDRLEAAFTLQRTFALDVAHELRTPLTALRGNLDVLLLDPALDREVRREIERLAAETGRMTRLTSNLLALAQSETGRALDLRPVEIDLLCLEVYHQARTLGSGVRLRLGHEDQVTALGDRDLLKQLVLNLVENAMKYTPPGGVVTLSQYAEGDMARIVVEDTGPGIRPEDLPRIFDRFYRAPAGSGRLTGGAGIGLAVARWIASRHGGRIEVESAPGTGSTFTVYLPLESGHPSAPLPPDRTVPAPVMGGA